jgi:uncharacterized membrane protein
MCKDANIDDKAPNRRKVLLTEYQAAQSSAQHHDQLLWIVTSIVWGGSLALMGIILNRPMPGLLGVISSFFLCVLGSILIVFVWSAQRQFRHLKNQKYERCKEIERELGMLHHLATKAGSQTEWYNVIMTLFLVAWLLVAMSVLCNCLTKIRQQEKNITVTNGSII